jgi:transposase
VVPDSAGSGAVVVERGAVLRPEAEEVMAGLLLVTGRPMVHDLRAMLDAVFYVAKNGVEWRALPVDYPPHAAVYKFFERWSQRELPGTLVVIFNSSDAPIWRSGTVIVTARPRAGSVLAAGAQLSPGQILRHRASLIPASCKAT